MVFSILKYWFFNVSFLLVVFFLGRLIYQNLFETTERKYKAGFYYLLTGLISVVSVYSLVITQGVTINVLIVLMLIVFLLFKKKREIVIRHHFSWRDLGFLLLVSLFSVVFLSFCFYSDNVWQDFPFYVRIVESMNDLHQESILCDLVEGTGRLNRGVPYHYVEFWIAAIFDNLNFNNSIPTFFFLRISSLSIFLSIGIFGFIAILNHFKNKINWLDVLLCTFILFLPFTFDELFIKSSFDFKSSFYERPNFIPLYPIFLAIILKLWEKDYGSYFLFLMVVVLIFSPITIVLSGAIMLTVFSYKFFFKKERIKAVKFGGVYFMFIVLYLLYYSVAGTKEEVYAITSLQESIDTIKMLWKAIIGESIRLFAQSGLIFLLYLVVLYSLNRYVFKLEIKKPTILLVATAVVFVCCLLAFQLFLKVDNSYQFIMMANVFLALVISSAVLMLLAGINKKVGWLTIFLVVLVGLSARKVSYSEMFQYSSIENRFQERTHDYIQDLSIILEEQDVTDGFLVGYETSPGYYESLPEGHRYHLVYTPYDQLSLFHCGVRMYCFDSFEKITKNISNSVVRSKMENLYKIRKKNIRKYEMGNLTKSALSSDFSVLILPDSSDLFFMLETYDKFEVKGKHVYLNLK